MSIPKLIGAAGFAGAGKDTLGDELARVLGYIKFSFSDALYREVSEAFSISIEYLQHRPNKERPTQLLAMLNCRDADFVNRCAAMRVQPAAANAPRDILQWWGTEYRREQDPDYWVKRARDFYREKLAAGAPGLVNCSVRFLNEAEWIHSEGGAVVRVHRPGVEAVNTHVSDKPLPRELVDAEIANDGDRSVLVPRLKMALAAKAA